MDKNASALPHPAEPATSTSATIDVALTLPCDRHRIRAEPRILDLGYREADGTLWYPAVGRYTHIRSFTREEALELIAAARKPVAGHDQLPSLEWLPEPEECIPEPVVQVLYDIKRDGVFVANWPLVPSDVYIALFLLLREFGPFQKNLTGALTKANLEHALLLKRRSKACVDALKHPRTQQIYGASWLQSSLADAERDHKRFAWTAKAIEREVPRHVSALQQFRRFNLEAFVSGPLAVCYEHLFDRDAGGNERGPFARFGECFFDLVGHQVAASTIVRAVKPRSKHRFRSPR